MELKDKINKIVNADTTSDRAVLIMGLLESEGVRFPYAHWSHEDTFENIVNSDEVKSEVNKIILS